MANMSLNQNIKKNIGIVVPAYNEEKNILELIKKIKKKIKNPVIVIVDDSIHKKTFNLIKSKKLKVVYLHRRKKLGRGSAVLTGLKKLIKNKKIKIFVEMDADLSHAPNELTSTEWRDPIAGTPWHKHVPARLEAIAK